jgi:hypothetical protein
MPWHYIVIGMLFAAALILIKSPSPMLIAVGMYLPFTTTAAIFIGGLIKWVADRLAARKLGDDAKAKETVENRGLLVASGLVAGEAMIGIVLAGIVATNRKIFCGAGDWVNAQAGKLHCWYRTPEWFHVKALGFLVILGLAVFMIAMSLRGVKRTATSGGAPPPDKPADDPGADEPDANEPATDEPADEATDEPAADDEKKD